MAIQRRISIDFSPIEEPEVRAYSQKYGPATAPLIGPLTPDPPGEWSNYLKAAALIVRSRWGVAHGIEAKVTSDLPAAAGLSSSSALLTGITIALLRASGIEPTIADLMDVLPDGEQFVGTRGGGMDHAAVLAAERGSALLVEFAPLRLASVPIPDNWRFIVAHSLTVAEKSGAAKTAYNSRRAAGQAGLEKKKAELPMDDEEARALKHVETETARVKEAVRALKTADARTFGRLLSESHASLRDDLRVSSPALDELVEIAMKSGALGARLTGAGFGGCAIVLCYREATGKVTQGLLDKFYRRHAEFDPETHLIFAEPSAGALRA